jgi:hypothetical protein
MAETENVDAHGVSVDVEVDTKKARKNLFSAFQTQENGRNNQPGNPRRSNVRTLLTETSEDEPLSRWTKCTILCGADTILSSLVMITLTAVNVFIFVTYQSSSERWVFFLLAIATIGMLSIFVRKVLKAACCKTTRVFQERRSRGTSFGEITKAWYHDVFDLDGKYFLLKLFLTEYIGNIQQVLNMRFLYLCRMPKPLVFVLVAIALIELCNQVWSMRHMDTQLIRNWQIKIDTFCDLFYLIFPTVYIEMNFPVDIDELILLIVVPTISILSKAYDLWNDYHKVDLQRIEPSRVSLRHQRSSHRIVARRNSIEHLAVNEVVFRKQWGLVPTWLRQACLLFNVAFVAIYGGLLCIMIFAEPDNDTCEKTVGVDIWRSCQLPTPFCGQPMRPRCDCAILKMSNFSSRTFPESFDTLKSLVKMEISGGKLEELHSSFGQQHEKLVIIDLSYQRITLIPKSITDIPYLRFLYLQNNSLSSLPENLGNLKNLMILDVRNNKLAAIPPSVKELSKLTDFLVSGNPVCDVAKNEKTTLHASCSQTKL